MQTKTASVPSRQEPLAQEDATQILKAGLKRKNLSQRSIPDLFASGHALTEVDFLNNDIKHMRLDANKLFVSTNVHPHHHPHRHHRHETPNRVSPERPSAAQNEHTSDEAFETSSMTSSSGASSCVWCEEEAVEEQELEQGHVITAHTLTPSFLAGKGSGMFPTRCKHENHWAGAVPPPPSTPIATD